LITVDTNVLVRLLLGDDAKQSAQAKALFESGESLTAPVTVMLELVWVLETYDLSTEKVSHALSLLVDFPHFNPQFESSIRAAIELYKNGLDFADALHLQLSGSSDAVVTLDRQFVSRNNRLKKYGSTEVVGLESFLRKGAKPSHG
jgi:predicted nucleic-acid-binding protein